MKEKVEPYGIVEQSVLFMPELSMRGKVMYCVLKTFADDNGYCFPRQEDLAEQIGISRPTLIEAIKDLVKAGLLKKGKKWKLNNYTILSGAKSEPDNAKPELSSKESLHDKPEPELSSKESLHDQVKNLDIQGKESLHDNRTIPITKPKRTIPSNIWHTPCKEFFLDFHRDNFRLKYQWTGVDAKNLNLLIKKLENVIKDCGAAGEFSDHFRAFLHLAFKDKWLAGHFEIAKINGQFNSIINKDQGNSSQGFRDRVMALLDEKHGNN